MYALHFGWRFGLLYELREWGMIKRGEINTSQTLNDYPYAYLPLSMLSMNICGVYLISYAIAAPLQVAPEFDELIYQY